MTSKIAAVMATAATDKALTEQLNATGCDADIMSAAQTVAKVKADSAKWGKVVKDANIKAE